MLVSTRGIIKLKGCEESSEKPVKILEDEDRAEMKNLSCKESLRARIKVR
jgi:hypothetical protein